MKDENAFPVHSLHEAPAAYMGQRWELKAEGGLTKREYFAAMAMQSIIRASYTYEHEDGIKMAITWADELIKQLETK